MTRSLAKNPVGSRVQFSTFLAKPRIHELATEQIVGADLTQIILQSQCDQRGKGGLKLHLRRSPFWSIRIYRGFDSTAGFFEGMAVVSETVTLRESRCWRQARPAASQRHPSAHPDRDIPGSLRPRRAYLSYLSNVR